MAYSSVTAGRTLENDMVTHWSCPSCRLPPRNLRPQASADSWSAAAACLRTSEWLFSEAAASQQDAQRRDR